MNREVIKNRPHGGGKTQTLWRALAGMAVGAFGGTNRPHHTPKAAYPRPYRPEEQRKADEQAKAAAEEKRRRRNAKRLRDWEGAREGDRR